MKKILILGAGTYQVPVIQKAVNRGYHVIAASWHKEDPGMVVAHENWVIDTKDKDRLLALSQKHRIDAVVTVGTDVSIPSLGYICDHLNLQGISHETAMLSTDKALMQKTFKAHGVHCAHSILIKTFHQAVAATEELSFPVVIKAPDSSGSRGIFIVKHINQLKQACENAFEVSNKDYILVEKFISGVEFGAQLIVLNKKIIRLFCFNDSVDTHQGIPVPIGHSLPFSLGAKVEQQTLNVCERAVESIGMKNGIANIDLIFDGENVILLEIGARLGGARIPEIIHHRYGIDLYDMALDLAFGITPEINIKKGSACAIRVLKSKTTGTITNITTDPALSKFKHQVTLNFDYGIGDNVKQFKVAPDRIGQVMATAKTAKEAEDLCVFAESCVNIDIQNSNV